MPVQAISTEVWRKLLRDTVRGDPMGHNDKKGPTHNGRKIGFCRECKALFLGAGSHITSSVQPAVAFSGQRLIQLFRHVVEILHEDAVCCLPGREGVIRCLVQVHFLVSFRFRRRPGKGRPDRLRRGGPVCPPAAGTPGRDVFSGAKSCALALPYTPGECRAKVAQKRASGGKNDFSTRKTGREARSVRRELTKIPAHDTMITGGDLSQLAVRPRPPKGGEANCGSHYHVGPFTVTIIVEKQKPPLGQVTVSWR